MAVQDRVNNGSSTFFARSLSSEPLASLTQEDGQKILAETKKLLVSVEKLVVINGTSEAKQAQSTLIDCTKKMASILNNYQKIASDAIENTIDSENTIASTRPRQ